MAWWTTWIHIHIMRCEMSPIHICSHLIIQMLIQCRHHNNGVWWVDRWNLAIKWTINNLLTFKWCTQVSRIIQANFPFFPNLLNKQKNIYTNWIEYFPRKWFTSTDAYARRTNATTWKYANEWIFCFAKHSPNVRNFNCNLMKMTDFMRLPLSTGITLLD